VGGYVLFIQARIFFSAVNKDQITILTRIIRGFFSKFFIENCCRFRLLIEKFENTKGLSEVVNRRTDKIKEKG